MSKTTATALNRRTVFVGAGAAGALAGAAVLLPRTPVVAAAAPKVAAVDGAAGYQATQHVLRYYQTAKV